jgi:hypothetical protein
MAIVTKTRNLFNCPLLLYYKSKWAQIFTAATWNLGSLTYFSGLAGEIYPAEDAKNYVAASWWNK